MIILEIVEKWDVILFDVCFDLFVEEELNVWIIIFFGCEDDVEIIFQLLLVCVGFDGFVSENFYLRFYGMYLKIIDEFVCEKNFVSLEEVVCKMIFFFVWIYGFQLKGIICEGFDVDFVLFWFEWILIEFSYNNVK